MVKLTRKKNAPLARLFTFFAVTVFISQFLLPPLGVAQNHSSTYINIPAPGTMLTQSQQFTPPLIKAITIDPTDALKFDFIIDSGDLSLQDDEVKMEADKLIKYFLAALTVPSQELWVNLSPYEKERIIPRGFGYTEMGRDLLLQDYVLKQLTASLMYPENELGKEFWSRVKQKAKEIYGTQDIPMNTFNKIWIVPEDAVVLEQGNNAIIIQSHLKVMLEEDYLALKKNLGSEKFGTEGMKEDDAKAVNTLTHEIVYELLIPEIEKEVNQGANFANLRQIYNSMILATWYKQSLQESFLAQVYADKNKVIGVNVDDPRIKEKIFAQYLKAFQVGAYSYSQNEFDFDTMSLVPRQYYSGGFSGEEIDGVVRDRAMTVPTGVSFAQFVSQLPQQDASRVRSGMQLRGDASRVSVSLRREEMTFDLPDLALGSLPTRIAESPSVFRQEAVDVLRPLAIGSEQQERIITSLVRQSTASKQAFNDNEDVVIQQMAADGVSQPTLDMIRQQGVLPQLARISQQRSSFNPQLASMAVMPINEQQAQSVFNARGVSNPAQAAQAFMNVRQNAPENLVSVRLLENALVSNEGLDVDTAHAIADQRTINQLFSSISTGERFDLGVASMPARVSADREAFAADYDVSLRALDSSFNDNQTLRQQTTQIVVETAEQAPAAFNDRQTLQAEFVQRGMQPQVAALITGSGGMQQVTQTAKVRDVYENSLRLMPVRISSNPQMFETVASGVMADSAIDQSTQAVVIDGLTDLSRTSPQSFRTETALLDGLRRQNVPEFAIAEMRRSDILPRLASISQDPRMAVVDRGGRGGIDFNAAMLNLVVEKEGSGVQMTVAASVLENLNLGGFEPVITQVDRVNSLQQDLGLDI